jgi:uncharacterized membrane protein YkvA (DUF1232 family)
MLKAFKAQLVSLAECSDQSLEKRFLKAACYPEATAHAKDLKNFILSLPELLQQTRIWFESDATPRKFKAVYGYLLTYVYHSLDFLPEEDFGFWGYLDDAYLAGLVYYQTIQYHVDSPKRFDAGFTEQVEQWLTKTRKVIPNHTAKLDALYERMMAGDIQAFDAAISNT